VKLPALDCLLRPEERSVSEDRSFAIQERVCLLEDPEEEEEDWGDTGKPQESASRYRVRALEVGLTWVAAGKVGGGQNAPCLRVDMKWGSRLLLVNRRTVVGLKLSEPVLTMGYSAAALSYVNSALLWYGSPEKMDEDVDL
jgi:hypothetical protein